MPNPAPSSEADRERERQAALDRLRLDEFADAALDDIARTAADLCATPVALVTVIDGDRQWFKARVGTELRGTPRHWAFCDEAIRTPDDMLIVEDTTLDPRFSANPLVVGEPHVRFYAGAPLVTASGHAIGTVCVLDLEPRRIDADKLESLRFLASQVVTRLEQRLADGS